MIWMAGGDQASIPFHLSALGVLMQQYRKIGRISPFSL